MISFLAQLAFSITKTLCIIGILIKIFKIFSLNSMKEILFLFGKDNIISYFIILSTINLISNVKFSNYEDFIPKETLFGDSLYWLYENILNTFLNENFLKNLWSSLIESSMVVILCKRHFTLNSSFLFLISLMIKNFHLPWIQAFRGLETLRNDVPMNLEIISLLSLCTTVFFEEKISRNLLKFSKRRLVNCFIGSEVNALGLILKGILVNKVLLILGSMNKEFSYKQLHCFYLRIVVFGFLNCFHIISLKNIAATKKSTFKLYIFTRIVQSTKDFIENFSELNRFRKMTISLNYSMSSPSEEELASLSDHLCIICRDEITQETSKKLSCGHIFHIACLQNWMIRQYSCPTCLTVISSKSKDPLKDTERTKYEVNRSKIDLLGLVVGCRKKYFLDHTSSNNNSKNISLPSLEPDFTSIMFSKKFQFFGIRIYREKPRQSLFLIFV